jgi:hypothetical protein
MSTTTSRHYPKIEELVRRTSSDLSPEANIKVVYAKAILEKMITPGPKNPSLISSAHGSISHLLLTIPAYAVRPVGGLANPIANAYKGLLGKLPKTVAFTVVTHAATEQTVADWFKIAGQHKTEILAIPDHLHFSVWAEDGYVVARDTTTNDTFFIEPFEFPRYADGLVADFVSNGTSLSHTQAPLYFQGGNVLIGDDFFFIGADYPSNSLKYINKVIVPAAGEKPVDTVHRLYGEYMDVTRKLAYVGSTIPVPSETGRPIMIDGEQWTEVLYMGNKPGTLQPLFHIDMFITLAGRDAAGDYQLVIGDPSLAAKTLGIPVWPHAMQEVFDNVASNLRKAGFKVIRNPLPLAYVDDPVAKERLWYFATANNALVQIGSTGEKSIWLPAYGFGNWSSLTATDQANVKIWEALGFNATLLADFHPFAENLGAVHCIKKYLARD